MRGISWENKNEPGVAILDYQNALRVDPTTTLDDVYIRLGRLIAQEQLLNGRGLYDPKRRATWEDHFQSAYRINPRRPQLFYDWGFALSQACACTQARPVALGKSSEPIKPPAQGNESQRDNAAPQANKNPPDSDTSKAHGKPLIAVTERGIETDNAVPTELPGPKASSKSVPAQKFPGNAAASHLPGARDASVSEPITPGTPAGSAPVGPTPDGSRAAIQALNAYESAESLSPNWWRLPLARAELMLNQCDAESPRGERNIIQNFKPDFLSALLEHHKLWKARHPGQSAPSTNAIAVRGGDTPEGAANSQSPPQPDVALPPPTVDVLSIAVDDFNRSISLNPNALDAYRDRAEALRLAGRLDDAQQSALTACNLCYYREAKCLRTLAQVCNETGHYQSAADYALRAAELTSGGEQQRFLNLWATYGKHASAETATLAVASERAGYVASRGDDDSGDHSTASDRTPRIEPPPGFLTRSGGVSPE
jgi:tetratricopeptide (TPR) repeat protein